MFTRPFYQNYSAVYQALGIAFLCSFFSCTEPEKGSRSDMLPGFVGQAGEVLVIMDDIHWQGIAGEVVREVLNTPVPNLPQYEPMFSIQHYSHENFDKLLHPHRNILFVDIRDNINYREAKIQIIREQYAKDQIVVNCAAMTADDFIAEFRRVSSAVLDRINEAETDRLINYYKRFGNSQITAEIRDQRGIEMVFPDLSKLTENHTEFVWAHKITQRPKDQQMHEIQQGIILYEYPYLDDSTFTKSYLLNMRDSVMKMWVPGPETGSYMSTERVHDDPVMRETTIDNKYAVEIRGLWKMQNAFMGGPFVSLTSFDEKRGMIVTVEGFVFAPKFDKREYLREVEACVKSMHYAATNDENKNQ